MNDQIQPQELSSEPVPAADRWNVDLASPQDTRAAFGPKPAEQTLELAGLFPLLSPGKITRDSPGNVETLVSAPDPQHRDPGGSLLLRAKYGDSEKSGKELNEIKLYNPMRTLDLEKNGEQKARDTLSRNQDGSWTWHTMHHNDIKDVKVKDLKFNQKDASFSFEIDPKEAERLNMDSGRYRYTPGELIRHESPGHGTSKVRNA